MHGPHIIGFFWKKNITPNFLRRSLKKECILGTKKSNCFMKLEKAFLDIYWHHFFWRNGSVLLLLVLNSKTAIYIFLVKMTLMLGFLNQSNA